MIPNTEYLPCSADLSAADLAAERFRANTGARRRLPEVPAEWQHAFTPETWAQYQSERFWAWHSEAIANLSPEGYLKRIAQQSA
jgi:hypothetical protein